MPQPDSIEVKARIDIVSLISETVPLKRSGANYQGFCPFHNNTKTEALAVFPETQTWRCFGACGDGGDIFNWVMKRDGLDFKQALESLAARAGVNGNGAQHNTPKEAESDRGYKDLAEYAQAHGVSEDVFLAAGWKNITDGKRAALSFPTKNGNRLRYIDGEKPKYKSTRGYSACWYGLERAIKLAAETGQPLIICNGEPSTIVGQHFNLAAAAVTGGEKAKMKPELLAELQAVYPTGQIIVAFDCDEKGRDSGPKLAADLTKAGYEAWAVDMGLGHKDDLADFCRLHGGGAAAALAALPPISKKSNRQATGPDDTKSSDYIDALKQLGYSFRLNVLDDTIEVNRELIEDILAAEIRTKMRDLGYKKGIKAMEDAYLYAASLNRYHPVKDYFEGLKYDGLPHINILSSYFQDTQGIFKLWLKKWLVGAVAKVYVQAQNPMLVLDGVQGRGKSFFAEWLCPEKLHKHFVSKAIDPGNNDHLILLMKYFIWEVGELGATTRKTDREALKHFVTLTDVAARKPYGHHPIKKPALASFIGTVNDEAGFLNDPTGSRRFLTCTLTEIDWDYSRCINVDDVWAEAYHLFKNGYQWELTPEEKKVQAEINEHYEIEDPLIAEILRICDRTDKEQDFLSSRDILNALNINHLEKRNTMRLAQAMKKLGIKKGKLSQNNDRAHGYFGLTLKGDIVQLS